MKSVRDKLQLLTFNLTGPSNAKCFASLTVSQIKAFPLTNWITFFSGANCVCTTSTIILAPLISLSFSLIGLTCKENKQFRIHVVTAKHVQIWVVWGQDVQVYTTRSSITARPETDLGFKLSGHQCPSICVTYCITVYHALRYCCITYASHQRTPVHRE